MSRVLTGTVVGPAHHRLGATPRDQLDPVVRELLAQATAKAYERGLREGRAQGAVEAEADIVDRLDRFGSGITAAVDDVARTARAACDDTVEAAFELATTMAGAILDHEPHDGGAVVADRIREALALLDDDAPVVHVSAADGQLVMSALAGARGVTVEVDADLAPGEARIRGGWADADLTRTAAFDAIRRSLHVDG